MTTRPVLLIRGSGNDRDAAALGARVPFGWRVPTHGVMFGGNGCDVGKPRSLPAHQPHLDGGPHRYAAKPHPGQ